jgi:hypothetical protein
MSDERFDGIFMNVVQQSQGIEEFFDNMFGFLGRKTDFYTQEEKALTIVTRCLTHHIQVFNKDKERKEAIEKKKADMKAKEEAEKKAREEAAAKKAAENDSQVMEVTEEEAARIEAEEAAKKAGKTVEPAEEQKGDAEKKEGEDDDENKGSKPNAGNGGTTDKYYWEQTLQEVTVNINIPDGVTGKQLKVDMTSRHLKVEIKGKETLIDQDFHKPIKVDDSLWCIETDESNKRVLQLSLTKKEGQNWWDCVLDGDEKINTGKVEPENSKLSDLDGETRGVVEKMMFD